MNSQLNLGNFIRAVQRVFTLPWNAVGMGRWGWFLALLLVLGLLGGCGQAPPAQQLPTQTSVSTIAAATAPPIPTAAQPQQVLDAPTAEPFPPTAEPAVTAIPDPGDLSIHADDIRLFPVPKIISGDRLTVQVLPHVPLTMAVDKVSVDIYVDGQVVSSDTLTERDWEGRAEGVFEWIWDTTGKPGKHEVRVVVDGQDLLQEGDEDPSNNEAIIPLQVLKASERPLEERDVTWISSETDCCVLHVIQQTAAYRDLGQLQHLVESAVSQAASRLNETPQEPVQVYFIERTIGQGGFSGNQMVITYDDRPYIGGELYELLVHEAVHVLDRQFAPQRIKFLAEGVAVWATGGHYKKEDLLARQAALLRLNEYIPLAELADNFYPSQHEIGYLEAGSFVKFLVDRAGWPTFREFYSNTSASDGATEAEALDINLRTYYGRSLVDLEAEWLDAAQAQQPSDAEVADLRTSIRYFDTARRYQTLYDPAAYFRTAWLPNPEEVREQGNTADLTRHPRTETNFTIEIMLRVAYEAMQAQEYDRANVLLDSVKRILDQNGSFSDPLAANYAHIVHTAVNFGYEPQQITLNGKNADVLVTTASGFHLSTIELEQRSGDWVFLAN